MSRQSDYPSIRMNVFVVPLIQEGANSATYSIYLAAD